MNDRELMQQGYEVPLVEQLDAVPRNARLWIENPNGMGSRHFPIGLMCYKAAEALRARLAQPEPEPYGYIARRNWKMPVFIEADNVEATGLPYNNADYEPVFKAPPQRERVQFPTMLRKMWSGGEDASVAG
jgi:hypothetical protein